MRARNATPPKFANCLATETLSYAFDEHIERAVTRALRLKGIPIVTVQEAGRVSGKDSDHLAWAASIGHVLVTHDHDFEQLHTGLVIVHELSPAGHVIEWVELIARAMSADEMRGQIIYVPRRP